MRRSKRYRSKVTAAVPGGRSHPGLSRRLSLRKQRLDTFLNPCVDLRLREVRCPDPAHKCRVSGRHLLSIGTCQLRNDGGIREFFQGGRGYDLEVDHEWALALRDRGEPVIARVSLADELSHLLSKVVKL